MSDPRRDPDGLSEAGRGRLLAALDDHLIAGVLDPARPFGPFRMVGELGRGRFGVVFRAVDTRSDREVAIKLPLSSVRIDAEGVRLLGRDVEAGVLMDHPGILPVLEAGAIDGLPYLVTPFVAGPTLAAWLTRHPGPVPPGDAVRLALALADATAHAQERGVLHCDLKPGNILLQPVAADPAGERLDDYTPLVTDFGLARLLARPAAETRTHLAAGTPPYMAPEQALGMRRGLTARCDVHGLGAILYELLAGAPPHGPAGSDDALLGLLDLDRRPAPLAGVPADLRAVVLKALEKRPDARYGSAAEFADDLRRWLDGRPTRARPVGPLGQVWREVLRRPLQAAIAGLVAAVVWLGWYLIADRARHAADLAHRDFYARLERVRRQAVEKPDAWAENNLTELRTLAAMPAAGQEQVELRSQAAAALAEPRFRLLRELAPGTDAYVVAFAPDGRTVALGERYPQEDGQGQLRVWLTATDTGVVSRTLTYPVDAEWEDLQAGRYADGARSLLFAPDGRTLFVGTRSGSVFALALEGADRPPLRLQLRPPGVSQGRKDDVETLTLNTAGTVLHAGQRCGEFACWEPGTSRPPRRRIGGWLPEAARPGERTWYLQADGAKPLDLTLGPVEHHIPMVQGPLAVAPDGGYGVVRMHEGGAANWVTAFAWPRLSRPLTGPDQAADWGGVAFSPDGLLLAVGSEEPPAVELRDTLSRAVIAHRTLRGGSGRLAFSPDGRLLAVCGERRALLYEVLPSLTRVSCAPASAELHSFAVSADGRVATLEAHTTLSAPPGSADRYRVLRLYGEGDDQLQEMEWARVPATDLPTHALAVPRVVAPTSYAVTTGSVLAGRSVETNLRRLGPAPGRVSVLRFDPAKEEVLWVGDERGLSLLSGDGHRKSVFAFSEQRVRAGYGITALDLNASGVVAGIGQREGALVHLAPSGEQRGEWPVFADEEVSAVALTPDGATALVGGSAGSLVAVRLSSGEMTRPTAPPHRAAVTAVAWLPGGAFLTASRDHTIRLWTGREEPILVLREAAPIEKAELCGGRLYVHLRGDWGLRVHRLDRLAEALRAMGIEPGFRTEPAATAAAPPGGLEVSHYGDDQYGWLVHRTRGGDVSVGLTARSRWTPAGPFSVRWEGYLRPPHPGRWELEAESSGAARAWVGGRLVLAAGRYRKMGARPTATLDLTAEAVPFRFDFASPGVGGSCQLRWRPEGRGKFVPVPAAAFAPPSLPDQDRR